MGMGNNTIGYQDPNVLLQKQVQQQLRAQTAMKTDHILYVADLPDDTSEEDLFSFFKEYQLKAVKLISVFSRSKAFITLGSREMADKAREELNGAKLAAKYSKTKVPKPIRICKFETKQMQETQSNENSFGRNLLIKNIPKEVSAHQYYKLLRVYGDIRSCKLVVNYKGESKGYGYVNYYANDSAEKAKTELGEKGINGKKIIIVNLQKGLTTSKLKNNIYVKNIPKETFSDEELKKLFATYGEIISAVVVRDQNGDSKGFGFVCFKDPAMAEKSYHELNNKKMFNVPNLPNLYVNFAMKKEERKEHLIKTRVEQLKQDQMMTIFAKIKDDFNINSKEDLENEIQKVCNFIKIQPKVVKINFVSKTAFLTMYSPKDAENFVNQYNTTYPLQVIYFNIYKPKQDRIKTTQFLQKAGLGQKKGLYKQYNQFDGSQRNPVPNQDMPPQGKSYYKKYNADLMMDNNPVNMMQNFNQMNNTNPRFQQYNNFSQMQNPNINNFPQQSISNENIEEEGEEEDVLAGKIYDEVEQYNPKLAGKITGMIKGTGVNQMKELLRNKRELKNVIDEAVILINRDNKK
jgi:RNA recognition motif-containing protein